MHNMKLVLVFPGITESGFNATGRKLPLVWINHGLASLSSSVKARGFHVELLDLRQLSGWDDVRRSIARSQPDVLGITMMSVDYESAVRVAGIAKESDPEIVVVVGGPHPTLMTDEVAREKKIDHVILGEGEISLVELLQELEKGARPPRVIQGVPPDLETLPFIDRELFACEEVVIDGFLPRPFVTLIAGRGCRYNCSFCQPAERKIFGPHVRRRSVANVIKELESLRDRYHFNSLMIHDDCLTEDEKWVRDFCQAYTKRAFRRPFVCQTRADIVSRNEEMVRSLRDAGLAMFLIGFESGSQRVLNLLRKGTTVEQNYRAAAICRKYGIRVWANYMLGIPTETDEEALQTLRMIRGIRPYRASPSFFTPHPGSDLYAYCVERDLSLVTSHAGFSRSPHEPKIRGVNYAFLNDIVRESVKMPLSVRIQRKMDSLFEKKMKPYFRRYATRGHA